MCGYSKKYYDKKTACSIDKSVLLFPKYLATSFTRKRSLDCFFKSLNALYYKKFIFRVPKEESSL